MTLYVSDYFTRATLRKAGFVDHIKDLGYLERQIFCIIASELSKMEAEEIKRERAKKGRH